MIELYRSPNIILYGLYQSFICITRDVMMMAQLIVRSSLAQNKRFIFSYTNLLPYFNNRPHYVGLIFQEEVMTKKNLTQIMFVISPEKLFRTL